MKVFISWSGETSNAVAVLLRDWLPLVLQAVDPYVSSEDIQKGSRWAAEVAAELDQSAFGILCVTPTNIAAPWLNFEAGALSKSIDRSRVVPFLFRLERAAMPQGPLVQFQSVLSTEDDVKKMVSSLNDFAGEDALDRSRLAETFEAWWPKLQTGLNGIAEDEGSLGQTSRSVEDLLADVLDSVRRQERLLSEPQRLLPPSYLEAAMSGQSLDAINTSLFELRASTGMLSAALQKVDAPDEVKHAAQTVVRASAEAMERLKLASWGETSARIVVEGSRGRQGSVAAAASSISSTQGTSPSGSAVGQGRDDGDG